MRSLTIRHLTTYRYRQPVAFGEHRLMLRPRDCHDQRVIEASLAIDPEPSSLHFVQDAYGNHVGVARFSGRARELQFASVVRLEHSPPDPAGLDCGRLFPIAYTGCDVDHWIERHEPDPEDAVGRWARQFVPPTGSIGAIELLTRLARGIHGGFCYRRREAKGTQSATETLRLGHGSCRDFAVLMIEAARSLGLAARFASGYLAVPFDEPAGGATHAWAQIRLPGTGWIDFDPTTGNIGKRSLVTVAVVRDPRDATPLHGTFLGFPGDHIDMEVQVTVTAAEFG